MSTVLKVRNNEFMYNVYNCIIIVYLFFIWHDTQERKNRRTSCHLSVNNEPDGRTDQMSALFRYANISCELLWSFEISSTVNTFLVLS